MIKEDIDKILEEYLSEYHSSLVKDYIQKMADRNNKAIEYIENNLYSDYGYKCTQAKEDLLNILQGSDKE